MFASFSQRTRSLLLAANTLAALSLIAGVSGCADALVYAKDSRQQGMNLYNQGDYADAAGSFTSATQQNPQDYRSYYYMGASYAQLHDYREAISSFRSCLAVMPLTLDGQNNVAFRDRTLDALATAIAHSPDVSSETALLEKQCAKRPSVENQWLLAKVYRYTGDADAAVDAYNKAVLIGMKNFALTKEAGLYEQMLGQTQRAAVALRQAHDLNPDDQEVTNALKRMGMSPQGNARGGNPDLAQLPAPITPAPTAEPAATQFPRE